MRSKPSPSKPKPARPLELEGLLAKLQPLARGFVVVTGALVSAPLPPTPATCVPPLADDGPPPGDACVPPLADDVPPLAAPPDAAPPDAAAPPVPTLTTPVPGWAGVHVLGVAPVMAPFA